MLIFCSASQPLRIPWLWEKGKAQRTPCGYELNGETLGNQFGYAERKVSKDESKTIFDKENQGAVPKV